MISSQGRCRDHRTSTGEIVAMVSLQPDFDPNHPAADPVNLLRRQDRIFNKITLGAYEMGSAFKIFNTAMAPMVNATMVKATTPFMTSDRCFTISDYHGKHRC